MPKSVGEIEAEIETLMEEFREFRANKPQPPVLGPECYAMSLSRHGRIYQDRKPLNSLGEEDCQAVIDYDSALRMFTLGNFTRRQAIAVKRAELKEAMKAARS